MSYQQLLEEPAEEVNKALLIWSLDVDRDKLETERRNSRT